MEKSVFAFLIFCLPGVGDYASRTAVFSPAFCRRDYAYCGLHMLLCNVSKLGNWKIFAEMHLSYREKCGTIWLSHGAGIIAVLHLASSKKTTKFAGYLPQVTCEDIFGRHCRYNFEKEKEYEATSTQKAAIPVAGGCASGWFRRSCRRNR